MRLEAIHNYIDDHFDKHITTTQAFVRQPSISADGTGMSEMAELVADHIQQIGGKTEMIATSGYPVVYGHIDVGAPRTLLVYCMYDVQPVNAEKWISPPFGGKIVNLEPFGDCIISRGILNSKGPLIGTFNALDAIRQVEGTYPINVKFMIEGEEELGSIHMPEAVKKAKHKLAADGLFFPFYHQDLTGKAIMPLGTKGLVFLELIVRGGDWGGPTTQDVHGMNAGWFASPTWVLVQALVSMISHDQNHILIDGVYDSAKPPSQEDEELLKKLVRTFDPKTQLMDNKVARFKYELDGIDLLRKYLFEPNLNINGIGSGHILEGMKTILPHEARAKIDIRIVPCMQPDDIVDKVKRHLREHGFGQVEVLRQTGYLWSKGSMNDLPNKAMIQAYRSLGFEPEIWPMFAGCAPLHIFTQELGLPFTIGGLGHGGHQHSPNEYATVEGIRLFEKSVVSFLHYFAGSK